MPDGKPLTVRFDVVNLFDTIYQIRSGSGIGVFAPQYGPRRGYYVGISEEDLRQRSRVSGLVHFARSHATDCAKSTEQTPVIVGVALLCRGNREDGAEMARAEAPQMQIVEPIAVAFDGSPHHTFIAMPRSGFISSKMAPVSRIRP